MNKVKNFFMSLVPFLLFEAFSNLAVIFVMGISLLALLMFGNMNFYDAFYKVIDYATDGEFSMGILIVFEFFALAAYGMWHQKISDKEHRAFPPVNMNVKSLVGMLVLSFGMIILINYVTDLETIINPAWYDSFEELMEEAGMGGSEMTWWLLIYTCLIAPVTEDLIFRGLTFHYSRKAFPIWLAIVWQAFLFGVMHMNVFQGIYAFVAGIFLGVIAWKGENVVWGMVLHIFYNSMQTLIPMEFIYHSLDNYFYFIIILTLGVGACIVGYLVFISGLENKREENEIYERLLAEEGNNVTGEA